VGVEPPSDGDLVRRFRAGEARAFETLVDRYKRPLYVLLVRIVGSADGAEDCLQECFVRLWKRLDEIDETRSLYAYLRKVAVNLGLNHLRARARRRQATASAGRELAARSAPADDPVGEPLVDEVREAIAGLEADQRVCLVLRVQEEMSYAEIAAATGTPLGTVMSRLSRARLALREKLKARAVL
jgi:RNA polymerase sigma-70 factor (ECF subfamily)